MYKNQPLLLVGIPLLLLVGACTPALPTETEAQLPASIVTRPPTDTPLPARPTASLPTHTPSPTVMAPESPAPPPTAGAAFEVCRDPERSEGGVETTPTPAAGISVELDRAIPPAPPARLQAQSAAEGVQLSWQGTGTDVDQFYQVYRMGEEDECWELIGVAPIVGDNQGAYTFNIPEIYQTEELRFAVTTVDIYGQESDLSVAVQTGADS